MNMIKCTSCGAENSSNLATCLSCGAQLNPSSNSPGSGTVAGGNSLFRRFGMWVWAGIAVLLILLLCATLSLLPRHIPAPASFAQFASADQTFSLDAPQNWSRSLADKPDESGSPFASDIRGVSFKRGDANIQIITNTLASLTQSRFLQVLGNAFGKLGNNTVNGTVNDWFNSQMDVLRKQAQEDARKQFISFREEPSTVKEATWGKGIWTQWTAAGRSWSLPHHMHGYLVIMVGKQRSATILCACPAESWAQLQPAFDRIINSLTETVPPQDNSSVTINLGPGSTSPSRQPAPSPNNGSQSSQQLSNGANQPQPAGTALSQPNQHNSQTQTPPSPAPSPNNGSQSSQQLSNGTNQPQPAGTVQNQPNPNNSQTQTPPAAPSPNNGSQSSQSPDQGSNQPQPAGTAQNQPNQNDSQSQTPPSPTPSPNDGGQSSQSPGQGSN